MLKMLSRFFIFLWFMLPGIILAATQPQDQPRIHGLGTVANSMLDPVSMVADFIGTLSTILGFSFMFGTIIKYRQYRRNPFQTPISSVIVIFVLGLLLLLIPLAYQLADTGIPK